MRRIDEELKAGAMLLAIIDRRRAETGDAALGSAIEKSVIDRCLSDLEAELSEERILVPIRVAIHRNAHRAHPAD